MKGYTLLELMVAMTAGMFLLAGVSMSYSAIKNTIAVNHELSHAQEVVRYTSQVFTRSIKQTNQLPVVSNDAAQLRVFQSSGTISCHGDMPVLDYVEEYTLVNGFLTCRVTSQTGGNALAVNLLKGVNTLNFKTLHLGRLVRITITPDNVPELFQNGIDIDIAVTRMIIGQI
jgi:Tfp pilus assembly protein PilW